MFNLMVAGLHQNYRINTMDSGLFLFVFGFFSCFPIKRNNWAFSWAHMAFYWLFSEVKSILERAKLLAFDRNTFNRKYSIIPVVTSFVFLCLSRQHQMTSQRTNYKLFGAFWIHKGSNFNYILIITPLDLKNWKPKIVGAPLKNKNEKKNVGMNLKTWMCPQTTWKKVVELG